MLKQTKFESKRYLKEVAALPCCICNTDYAVVAHHIKGKQYTGTSYKAPDDMTMPLCHEHHSELHDHGYRQWEMRYGHQADYVRMTKDTLSKLLVSLQS